MTICDAVKHPLKKQTEISQHERQIRMLHARSNRMDKSETGDRIWHN